MKTVFSVLIAMLLAQPAMAQQGDLVDQTVDAIDQIDAARDALSGAGDARDRVRALTETLQAFEGGLMILRANTRMVSTQEAAISETLQEREAKTANLLAALQTFGSRPASTVLLHPAGPAGSARAGLLLTDVATRLDAEAAFLRRDLERLAEISALRQTAEASLSLGLQEVQQARLALNSAIANREPLPKRLINDPVDAAVLTASANTLEEFAAGLDRIAVTIDVAAPDTLPALQGALALPVRGRIIAQSGDAGPDGVARPGIIIETLPNAVVTTPVAATLRYAGPLLEMGNVVILEPQSDVLVVFAGLGLIYGEDGDFVEAGAPLGLMGPGRQKNKDIGSTDGDEGGIGPSDALYIEVRQNNLPEDPGLWFQTEQDG
ncbi:MAG: murein hydrolase activator EnvC [Roseobacter sp.]